MVDFFLTRRYIGKWRTGNVRISTGDIPTLEEFAPYDAQNAFNQVPDQPVAE